jgi:hypothetical protein
MLIMIIAAVDAASRKGNNIEALTCVTRLKDLDSGDQSISVAIGGCQEYVSTLEDIMQTHLNVDPSREASTQVLI